MIFYNYVGVQKICLTTKLDGIVSCHTGYFLSKISSQQRSSCKNIKYVPICTHINLIQYIIFTVIFVHLDVVIREGDMAPGAKTNWAGVVIFMPNLVLYLRRHGENLVHKEFTSDQDLVHYWSRKGHAMRS